jgi:hypothetical protein
MVVEYAGGVYRDPSDLIEKETGACAPVVEVSTGTNAEVAWDK